MTPQLKNTIEDYKKKFNNDFAITKPSYETSNPIYAKDYVNQIQSKPTQNNDVDYYELAKKQEYTTLLDKEIQLENAKSNALKYANNQMANSGFATQGYGNSANLGIYNNYLNAFNQANAEYNSNVNNLNYQKYQEDLVSKNDRFESVTQMMIQASNEDQLNNLMRDYGYGDYDSNGNFVLGNKPEDMSDDDWNQLKYYYNLTRDNVSDDEYSKTYGDISSWSQAEYVNSSGSTKTIYDNFQYESSALWANIDAGKYKYGTTIKLQNGSGEVIYVQWTRNGLRFSNEETYKNSKNKDALIWGTNVRK